MTAKKKHLRAVQPVNTVVIPLKRMMPPITFTDANFKGIDPVQNDLMVIMVEIENFTVMKTLVDLGSSVDILYWKTFKKLQIPECEIQGYIDLYTKFGEGRATSKTLKIRYLLVDANTSYNILLGISSLNLLGAIVSTPHLAMKFPSPMGDVITIHMDQKTARECYAASLRVEPANHGREAKKHVVQTGERSPVCEPMVALTDLDPRTDEVRV